MLNHHALKMSHVTPSHRRTLLQSLIHHSRPLPTSPRRSHSTSTESALPRPSFAPKPALDTKSIREQPELYAQNCIDRNYTSQADDPAKLAKLHHQWRQVQGDALALRKRNNQLRTLLSHSKTFSDIPAGTPGREDNKEGILEESRQLKEQIQQFESAESELVRKIEELAITQPNLTSSHTPIGSEPELLGYINAQSPDSSPTDRLWRSHVHIGSELDLLDFQAASTASGWGWYYLKNEAALLEQALVQYATSVARKYNFGVVSPPSMVYSHIASACGFHPRDQGGEQQVYAIQNSAEGSKAEMSMAGTAEIPFAAMKADAVLEEADLPLRVVGSSRCYRAEAGSRGVSTKGLYRVHEFTKVEMFGWTPPDMDSANALFTQMVSIQKEILSSLGLFCRVLEQPSHDLGASATRKQDIEAWFPSRQQRDGGWGEVTSTSICTDYQTRRLATRLRTKGGAKTFPYTVNGTAMAVPRVLAAILETHWSEQDGCVKIPVPLWPWMHGIKEIRTKRPKLDTP